MAASREMTTNQTRLLGSSNWIESWMRDLEKPQKTGTCSLEPSSQSKKDPLLTMQSTDRESPWPDPLTQERRDKALPASLPLLYHLHASLEIKALLVRMILAQTSQLQMSNTVKMLLLVSLDFTTTSSSGRSSRKRPRQLVSLSRTASLL